MIIKCAVVDDEPLAVELLASYVKKIPFLELCGKYTNEIYGYYNPVHNHFIISMYLLFSLLT